MQEDTVVFTVFAIFAGSAVIATLALFARQALLVAYILLGVLFGPSVIGVVSDPELVEEMAHIGIIFLLFLMGLELNPRDLVLMLRKTMLVTLVSAFIFASVGTGVALIFGYTLVESLLVGCGMMFSSTIVGLKLLPTTVLHHQRTGEIVISILLLQDLIAILLLLALEGGAQQEHPAIEVLKLILALPLLVGTALIFVRQVLLRLIQAFDTIKEYVFLIAIGWCLSMAEAASALGLSYEMGAFVGGVALASHPISLYMAENLRPLRDFFLILFFFSLGAGFQLSVLGDIWFPALVLSAAMLFLKPPVFRLLLVRTGETRNRSREIGWRLGQLSEFSLLIAVLALERGAIGFQASYLIQLATLLSFLVSVYLVVLRFPSPIALSDALRRD